MNMSVLAGAFALDKSQGAAQQIYDYLRAAIVRLKFKPGMELDRAGLAHYFGVSVTPVRDALLKLEEDELVDIFPQHGTRVRAVDLESARNAHFLRLTLELEIARTLKTLITSGKPTPSCTNCKALCSSSVRAWSAGTWMRSPRPTRRSTSACTLPRALNNCGA